MLHGTVEKTASVRPDSYCMLAGESPGYKEQKGGLGLLRRAIILKV